MAQSSVPPQLGAMMASMIKPGAGAAPTPPAPTKKSKAGKSAPTKAKPNGRK